MKLKTWKALRNEPREGPINSNVTLLGNVLYDSQRLSWIKQDVFYPPIFSEVSQSRFANSSSKILQQFLYIAIFFCFWQVSESDDADYALIVMMQFTGIKVRWFLFQVGVYGTKEVNFAWWCIVYLLFGIVYWSRQPRIFWRLTSLLLKDLQNMFWMLILWFRHVMLVLADRQNPLRPSDAYMRQ